MRDELARLGTARRARKWLEEEIKRLETPHLEAARAASAQYRSALVHASEAEAAANEAAQREYQAANAARREQLLAREEVAQIALPEGWSVRMNTVTEITRPDEIPRELCSPDKRRVTDALKRAAVPGARLVQIPVFALKG